MKNILMRLYGLVIILRALLPILLLLAAILITRQAWIEIRAATSEPIHQINENIDKMNDKIEDATQGFQVVSQGIEQVSGAVNQATGLVGNIPASINLDLNPVPVPDGFNTTRIRIPNVISFDLPVSIRLRDFNLDRVVPIPGLVQVKIFLGDAFGFFTDITKILTGIVNLVSITREMNAIFLASQQVVTETVGVLQRWLTVTGIILALAFVLLLSAYAEYLVRNLNRGWTLLTGRFQPA